ncbi:universal stress protein [Sphaerimonospora cavernae]|uniref:Universal stress protein n=1 Tax=Sphaerimonospora cavernae TaxID=1740611 RepID=A0ABV6TYR1_9ACTN
MFRRIVVAYDDSQGAQRALAAALTLARADPAEVIAVAVEAHLPRYGATVGEVEEECKIEQQECTRWLNRAQAVASEQGVRIDVEIRVGHPAQELLRAADAVQADLIAIGHSGHSAVWGRFLGSTTDKVSRHAHCSVLIVR